MSRFKIEHIEMGNWNCIDTNTGKGAVLQDVCMLYNSIEDELTRVDVLEKDISALNAIITQLNTQLDRAFDAGYSDED